DQHGARTARRRAIGARRPARATPRLPTGRPPPRLRVGARRRRRLPRGPCRPLGRLLRLAGARGPHPRPAVGPDRRGRRTDPGGPPAGGARRGRRGAAPPRLARLGPALREGAAHAVGPPPRRPGPARLPVRGAGRRRRYVGPGDGRGGRGRDGRARPRALRRLRRRRGLRRRRCAGRRPPRPGRRPAPDGRVPVPLPGGPPAGPLRRGARLRGARPPLAGGRRRLHARAVDQAAHAGGRARRLARGTGRLDRGEAALVDGLRRRRGGRVRPRRAAHVDHRLLGRRRDRHLLRTLRRGRLQAGRADRHPGGLFHLPEGPRQRAQGVRGALLRRPVLDRGGRRRPLRGVGVPVGVRGRRPDGGGPRERL
ncbi:MAG: Epoxide hydrolase, partial [uncultured Rubrobacteraceae bacterium]